jgi:hypothetical protein
VNNRRDGDGVSEEIAEVVEGFDGSAIRCACLDRDILKLSGR